MRQPASAPQSRDRRNPRISDMVRSVVVVLVIIVVVTGGYHLITREPDDPAPAVPWRPALSATRAAATFPIAGPTALPSGWKATSVTWKPGHRAHWHLGVLTSATRYIGLEEQKGRPDQVVPAYSLHTSAAGTVQIAGTTWHLRHSASTGETSVWRAQDGVTTVVTGSAPQSQIVSYTAGLRFR